MILAPSFLAPCDSCLRSDVALLDHCLRRASGTIQAVNEDDPQDPRGPKLPYVVKMDPPGARLISVPMDDCSVCRAEVCFGQRAGALWFTLFSLPVRPSNKKRRFQVGERVACAVEDDSDDYSVWASGTILDVDFSIEMDATAHMPDREWAGAAGCVPYRVQLDSGSIVLAHRDEHWLVRDLALQAVGPRQLPIGAPSPDAANRYRSSDRIVKRQRPGDNTWEAVDHDTRRVRPCNAPSDEED